MSVHPHMKIQVLGGCAAWPAPGIPCGGYLVTAEGFRLLLDPGYGTMVQMPEGVSPLDIDAVYVSHGHPDHFADIHPLLRARVLEQGSDPRLPIYALPGSLDRVLSLDGLGELDRAFELAEFTAGDRFDVGPFRAITRSLPHFVPNAGIRIEHDEESLVYTGDTGPDPGIAELANGADTLIAEATFPDVVPDRYRPYLSTAVEAAKNATAASVSRLMLTHLWPGSTPDASLAAARGHYVGEVHVARPGLELG
jgi:ribonuclease BN (tRNA processing enzyme)